MNSVDAHLGQHATDRLGNCDALPITSRPLNTAAGDWNVSVLSNPSTSYFTVNISTQRTEKITLQVMDISGKILNQVNSAKGGTLRFGEQLIPGMYLVEVRQGEQRKILKLIKL